MYIVITDFDTFVLMCTLPPKYTYFRFNHEVDLVKIVTRHDVSRTSVDSENKLIDGTLWPFFCGVTNSNIRPTGGTHLI